MEREGTAVKFEHLYEFETEFEKSRVFGCGVCTGSIHKKP
jgi:hypothetical protein